MAESLTPFVFYNCPEPAVTVANFAKGLGAAMQQKAVQDRELVGEIMEEVINSPVEVRTVVVG